MCSGFVNVLEGDFGRACLGHTASCIDFQGLANLVEVAQNVAETAETVVGLEVSGIAESWVDIESVEVAMPLEAIVDIALPPLRTDVGRRSEVGILDPLEGPWVIQYCFGKVDGVAIEDVEVDVKVVAGHGCCHEDAELADEVSQSRRDAVVAVFGWRAADTEVESYLARKGQDQREEVLEDFELVHEVVLVVDTGSDSVRYIEEGRGLAWLISWCPCKVLWWRRLAIVN